MSETRIERKPGCASMRQQQALLLGSWVQRNLDSFKHRAHPFPFLPTVHNSTPERIKTPAAYNPPDVRVVVAADEVHVFVADAPSDGCQEGDGVVDVAFPAEREVSEDVEVVPGLEAAQEVADDQLVVLFDAARASVHECDVLVAEVYVAGEPVRHGRAPFVLSYAATMLSRRAV